MDQFVLGATGVYWMRGLTLLFTSAEGDTHQSRGPTDEYGTHVLQLAAFDTRTGEQLYRTPDEEPDGRDLAVLYGEIMPLLHGVSNERSTIFDMSMWPAAAVVYESTTGRPHPMDAPWEHFILVGWSDEHTFFGVAERLDDQNADNVRRAKQVVTCELRTLACTPVSPVIPTEDDRGESPAFLMEGSSNQL